MIPIENKPTKQFIAGERVKNRRFLDDILYRRFLTAFQLISIAVRLLTENWILFTNYQAC